MKKSILIVLSLFLSCLLFASLSMGATVLTLPNPADGTTGVYTEIGTFSLTVESTTDDTHCVNISLYKGTTNVTDVYLTAQTNGSKSLTLPSLDGSTLYRIEIDSNDSSGFTHTNYTFTTGTKRLSDRTDVLGAGEILIIGIIVILVVLGFLYWFVQDFRDGTLSLDKVVQKLILAMIFGVIITVIASLM